METVIAQDANVNADALPGDMPNMLRAGQREVMIPLKRLVASPYNQRKKKRDQATIVAIADNMLAVGQLQNLVVHKMPQRAKKAQEWGVDAGETRRQAFLFNVERGYMSMDDEVRCIEISEAQAILASASENDLHVPPHPADQFAAYKALADEGRSPEFIAAVFNVSPKVVAGRLKLASVSPKLFELFAADVISLEQIKALAITDDHKRQEAAWFGAKGQWNQSPSALRNVLKGEKLSFGDRMVRFVTVAAYEAAGGEVERDLFAAQDDGFIVNRELLARLFDEKIACTVESIKAEGWNWVEARPTFDYDDRNQFTQLYSTPVPLTGDEKAKYEEAQMRADELSEKIEASYDAEVGDAAYLSDEDREKLDAECNQLYAIMQEMDDRDGEFTSEQMKVSGAIVTVGYDGALEIVRGLVRREDRAQARAMMEEAGQSVPRSLTKKVKGLHSEKLLLNLTSHRTAAVQTALVANPGVALVAVAHRLLLEFVYEHYSDLSAVQIKEQQPMYSADRAVPGIKELPQYDQLARSVLAVTRMIPKNPNELFGWLLEQPQAVVLNILAVCTALSLNGVSRTEEPNAINALAGALELDLTKYWKPTCESYLNHVSKDRIVAIVSDVISKEHGARLGKMKKAEAAQEAEKLLADKNWLPEFMAAAEVRTARTYFGDDGNEQEDADGELATADNLGAHEEVLGDEPAQPDTVSDSPDGAETGVKPADVAPTEFAGGRVTQSARFPWPFATPTPNVLAGSRPAA
ncbi:ParB/RepB/Spo0J family partition protein [Burkholderia multivorans]|uniref:ParB/RepB/Spo0J family partition protein n=1 Tax=Burkholderia multivorans TaxID=87883 RepID=UPI0019CFD1B1|nr:ParB/RepB/Spo0J family partition protein [Burkholderia multivorans]MBN6738878.1 ParB/RepB/Spo0J family partition protein [Burkholderia multivorans]MBN7130347.1 ParB/RepB/Spo0J family partition protein [Burkholderia multivorans]MBN8173352.1 ParB/RepB/Spo0J family partition protein [Burkholderia multivorans]MBU9576516.1 ParB N-terminal domain-containing protein [Burkholderia multivorans]MDN7865497.1 ParB N-terminal domain-containing protein [Burkholderia multivorans]